MTTDRAAGPSLDEPDHARYAFGLDLVREAGRMVLAEPAGVISTKSPFDLVTERDLAIERMARARIAARYPRDRVFGEEEGAKGDGAAGFWVVDPIDGTVNFALGLPFYAIALAYARDGVVRAAWVHDPLRAETFGAAAGAGAYLEGHRLSAPNTLPAEAALLLSTGILSAGAARPDTLGALVTRYGKVRILGSQALHLAYVAASRARAAMTIEAKPWDNLAGALIAAESGLAVHRHIGGAFHAWDGRVAESLAGAAGGVPGEPCIAARPNEISDLAARMRALLEGV